MQKNFHFAKSRNEVIQPEQPNRAEFLDEYRVATEPLDRHFDFADRALHCNNVLLPAEYWWFSCYPGNH